MIRLLSLNRISFSNWLQYWLVQNWMLCRLFAILVSVCVCVCVCVVPVADTDKSKTHKFFINIWKLNKIKFCLQLNSPCKRWIRQVKYPSLSVYKINKYIQTMVGRGHEELFGELDGVSTTVVITWQAKKKNCVPTPKIGKKNQNHQKIFFSPLNLFAPAKRSRRFSKTQFKYLPLMSRRWRGAKKVR